MDKAKKILKEFAEFCIDERISRAATKLIPYVGSSIYELIYGEDTTLYFQKILDQSADHQREIIVMMKEMMRGFESGSLPIFTIGSGNIEFILQLDSKVQFGQKHYVDSTELPGGSCVNHSMRLLSMGYDVYPIPSIADDRAGLIIKEHLLDSRARTVSKEVVDFINSTDFFVPHAKTPHTVIIVQDGRRTNLSHKLETPEIFAKHVEARLDELDDTLGINPDWIMIGHIYSDALESNPGKITKRIIERYSQHSRIYANLGNSQIQLGFDFWKDELSNFDILQLNLSEARTFFGQGNKIIPLAKILDFLRKSEISAVITLDKLGAIGTFKDGSDGQIDAFALEIDNFVDPTGSGDAFAAGMVSSLCGKKDLSFGDFFTAFKIGRLWAANACTAVGGSGSCPSGQIMEEFKREVENKSKEPVEIHQVRAAEQFVRLVDKFYSII